MSWEARRRCGQKQDAPRVEGQQNIPQVDCLHVLHKLSTPNQVDRHPAQRPARVVVTGDASIRLAHIRVAIDATRLHPAGYCLIEHATWPTAHIQHILTAIALHQVAQGRPILVDVPKMPTQVRRQEAFSFGEGLFGHQASFVATISAGTYSGQCQVPDAKAVSPTATVVNGGSLDGNTVRAAPFGPNSLVSNDGSVTIAGTCLSPYTKCTMRPILRTCSIRLWAIGLPFDIQRAGDLSPPVLCLPRTPHHRCHRSRGDHGKEAPMEPLRRSRVRLF